ncbi:MAG: hypothetical protein J6J17_00900 [Bacilli bacterium]|nr:hypothetical protein [Bacilli bacterium]
MEKFNSIFYMYSRMDRSSQTLLFLIVLVTLMLISICIINIITKRKNEKYDRQFNHINRYSDALKKETKQIKISKNDKNIENIEKKIESIKKIESVKEDEEDIEVIEVINEDSSIEGISKLIEDNLEQEPIDLTTFEEEQEKDAIISYDELVKRAGAKKIVYKKADIKEETIDKKVDVKIDNEAKTTKFKASQIVSPVYGVQKVKKENEDIELFIDLEEFPFENNKNNETDEMQKDIEFLGSLKSFRSELD